MSKRKTDKRLSFDEYGCLLALSAKSRSEDKFTKVGGVGLDKYGRVLGVSYNGLKSGFKYPDWMDKDENRKTKSELMIHAESNLCSLLKRNDCHTICLTISPCVMCCQQICALNIKRVVYLKEYHSCKKFKEFFDFHKIEYKELNKKSKNKIKGYLETLMGELD